MNGTAQRAQAYTYDGWGNLTNKTPTLGTAQSLTLNIDPATNRVIQTPACYDANGNMIGAPPSCSPALTFDVTNRIATVAGGPTYSYDAKNKRISTLHSDGTEELFFYGPNGRKLSTIHLSPYADSGPTNNIIYFADRIVGNSSGALIQDRRGSIGAYDPWGEDPNNTGNDTEKFATYTRDNATGLDYADQRYYTSQFGRFMSADPLRKSAFFDVSISWNRYTYVLNDPINETDSTGLCEDEDECDFAEGVGGGAGAEQNVEGSGGNNGNSCDDGSCRDDQGDPLFISDSADSDGCDGGCDNDSLDDTVNNSTGNESFDSSAFDSPISFRACTAASVGLGTLIGGAAGSTLGAGFGAAGGAFSGTFILPGFGTIAVGFAGAEIGSVGGGLAGASIGGALGALLGPILCAEHVKGARPSTLGKHQKGDRHKKNIMGGRKSPPLKRPGWWPKKDGAWPPKPIVGTPQWPDGKILR